MPLDLISLKVFQGPTAACLTWHVSGLSTVIALVEIAGRCTILLLIGLHMLQQHVRPLRLTSRLLDTSDKNKFARRLIQTYGWLRQHEGVVVYKMLLIYALIVVILSPLVPLVIATHLS